MNANIDKVYLSLEWQNEQQQQIDYSDNYTDVMVRFEDGKLYTASFFTFHHLERIRRQSQLNKEYLNGKFFWAEGMVLIESCSREMITEVIGYLLEEGDFERVFRRL